jgi:hypothetical protein
MSAERSLVWDALREAADAADDAICPVCKELLRVPVWHCVGGGHLHAQVRAGIEPEPRIESLCESEDRKW